MINKKVPGVIEALEGVSDNMTLILGGFGLSGIPENSIAQLVKLNIKGLTCISNNAGIDDFGLGLLLQQKQIIGHVFNRLIGQSNYVPRAYPKAK